MNGLLGKMNDRLGDIPAWAKEEEDVPVAVAEPVAKKGKKQHDDNWGSTLR